MNPAKNKRPKPVPLQKVLLDMRRKYDWTQTDVADAINQGAAADGAKATMNQSRVSRMEKYKPDDPTYRALTPAEITWIEDWAGMPRGTFWRAAGRVEDDISLEDRVLHDPGMSRDDAELIVHLIAKAKERYAKANHTLTG